MSGLSFPRDEPAGGPSLFDRIADARHAGGSARDWLDARGKGAWLVLMILGFVFFWPLGLAILAYLIWSNRMFSCSHRGHRDHIRAMHARRFGRDSSPQHTGNTAFDAYRDETLKRLEEEHAEFLSFLGRLREARDKAEFDQFMAQRRAEAGTAPTAPDMPNPGTSSEG